MATTQRRLPRMSPPRRERGAILVVALMFLVLLTIIGVSSMSGTTLEEKMAGNQREQNIAFQAAESALRDAEIDLETATGGLGNRDPMTIAANFATLCSAAFTNGVCKAAVHTTQIVTPAGWSWTDANKTVAYGTYTGADTLGGVFRQPRYVIEYLSDKDVAPNTRHFRISARGWGANQNSSVTLQTVYKMPMN